MSELRWSYERPTEPGAYLHQSDPNVRMELVTVDRLIGVLFATDKFGRFDLNGRDFPGRWWGPIVGPDPAEPWTKGGE